MKLNTCISLFVLLLVSCNRIANKGKELASRTGQKIENKSRDLSDKVFPHFDAYTPDTKFNKQRFKDFLKVELTPDVHEIYCFDDAIGIDADYQFSFRCDTATVRRILVKNELTLDTETTDYGFGMQHDFAWWDKQKIAKLKLYSWNNGEQYFKYFWYDGKEGRAYFFDYDL